MDNNNMIPAAPVAEKSGAKKSSGLMIATVLFGISTIALGTTLAIKMMNDESGNAGIENKTGNKCIVTQDDVENLDESEVSEIIANYNSEKEIRDLVEEARGYAETKIGSTAPEAVLTYNSGVVAEVEEGYYIRIKKGYGIRADYKDGVFDTVDAEQNYSNAIAEFLVSKGFEKNEKISGNVHDDYYDNGTLRCNLTTNVFPFGLSCSDTTWVDDEDMALAKALIDPSKESDYDTVIDIDRSKMETSSDGNYEGIKVGMYKLQYSSGVYALYYHEIGAEEWTFVLAGNGIPTCSQFENVPDGLFTDFGCRIDDTNDVVNVGDL